MFLSIFHSSINPEKNHGLLGQTETINFQHW